QLLQDQFLDPGRVGLAARGLHDRADQGADRRHLAAADLVRDARVAGDGLLDGGGERALVGDDLQAALLHDLVGVALAARPPWMTWRASLSLRSPEAASSATRATCAGVMASSSRALPDSLALRASSPIHHLRAEAASAPASMVATIGS